MSIKMVVKYCKIWLKITKMDRRRRNFFENGNKNIKNLLDNIFGLAPPPPPGL